MATDSVIGAWTSPSTPGSSYVLFHHVMGEVDERKGAWAYVEGGMGAVSQAIANSAKETGTEIFINAAVKEILIENNKTKGVRLENGDIYYSNYVLSNATPSKYYILISY